MHRIRTNAAAAMLGVSPNTLRSWERRYGYPSPHRSTGGHRLYDLGEIHSLKTTLVETQNVSSAIALAQQRGIGPSSSARLGTSYATFERDAADRLLEESLSLRSIERTIDEVLLPAVSDHPGGTAERDFAARHAIGWLSALARHSPPATRPEGVMLIDASSPLELDGLYCQSLDLVLRRAGLRTLLFGATVDPVRLGRAVRALRPTALVLSGRNRSPDTIGRIVTAVRTTAQTVVVYDFRGAIPNTGATTVTRLPDSPLVARDRLLAHLTARHLAVGAPRSPAEHHG